ncbi:hypothetical protein C4D60_Mb08t17140 [Musa balbisiana]|uniref:Uncharacterized protein n=1 Tax=Musa balbisiana TaxID=52838 RepID=A0A4S8K4F4_MUSBA|nr:hypothetical protein C4D60_Mb08t17140 [Musa balbisiana]
MQSDALDLVRDAALNDRVDFRLTGDVAARSSSSASPPPGFRFRWIVRSRSALGSSRSLTSVFPFFPLFFAF